MLFYEFCCCYLRPSLHFPLYSVQIPIVNWHNNHQLDSSNVPNFYEELIRLLVMHINLHTDVTTNSSAMLRIM